jgi:GDP-mannose transporter
VADALFLGREWPSARSWVALSVIAAGAYGYALTDEQFKTQGIIAYFWPTLYLLVISFEMAYGKKIISGVDLKTRSGPVLYTNMLGWPPMLGFAWMGGEYGRFYNDIMDNAMKGEPLFSKAAIILSLLGCIVGTGIGYSGWYCRDKVSAASYTLIGVMNKCLTVLVNLLIWDNHAPMEGIASLALCLVGGSFYSQAPMKKSHIESAPNVTDKDEERQDNVSMAPLLRRGGAAAESKP